MTDPTFGMKFNIDDNEARPAIDTDMSIVGLTGPAADAADGIPINQPIEFNSSDSETLRAIGASNFIGDGIAGINSQLGEFMRAARIVYVRTKHSDSEDPEARMREEMAHIVGDAGQRTGMHAHRLAGPLLGPVPRLHAAPGYTGLMAGPGLANPVVSAYQELMNQLLGVAVVDDPGTTKQAAVDWRETIQSKRIIPVSPAWKVSGADGSVLTRPLSGRVLGIAVRRDYEKGGKPFHSWANQPIYGGVGPSRPMEFSLTDGATEAQELLAKNIGVVVRGESGMADSIAEGGFVYVGTDTCAEDDLWRFYNVVRGRDYIHLMLLRTLRYYLGRFNITPQTIQSILNTMNYALRDLQADEHILGYKVEFVKAKNSPEKLRLGNLRIGFKAEEPPVLRKLEIDSARYRVALDEMIDKLINQYDLIGA